VYFVTNFLFVCCLCCLLGALLYCKGKGGVVLSIMKLLANCMPGPWAVMLLDLKYPYLCYGFFSLNCFQVHTFADISGFWHIRSNEKVLCIVLGLI